MPVKRIARGAVIVAMALTSVARADDVYTWTDEDGVPHYTNDPKTIPKGKQAKITKGAELGSISASSADSSRKRAKPALQDEVSDKDIADESFWRSQFTELRRHIAALKAQLPEDRARLELIPEVLHPQGNAYLRQPNPDYENLKKQIADEEESLRLAERDLDELDHQASKRAIPLEWRK